MRTNRSRAIGAGLLALVMLMAACAYNLQKFLTHIQDPKNKVQVLPSQHLLVLYFVLRYVVQHPGGLPGTLFYAELVDTKF